MYLAITESIDTAETAICKNLWIFLFSQETGSFEWAYDKVAGIQRGCMLEIMTRNNSEINDTQSAIDQVTDDASEIISFTCTPFDCSGHGECVNGICNCDTG
jgi:hypothetical protein